MEEAMLTRKAEITDLDAIYSLVQGTIKAAYAECYTHNEIEFFMDLHSKEAIEKDVLSGLVYVLMQGEKMLATCTVENNHLSRMYVTASELGCGCGTIMAYHAEKEVFKKYGECFVETSIPAKKFYGTRGYSSVSTEKIQIRDGEYLQYEVMKKINRSEQ